MAARWIRRPARARSRPPGARSPGRAQRRCSTRAGSGRRRARRRSRSRGRRCRPPGRVGHASRTPKATTSLKQTMPSTRGARSAAVMVASRELGGRSGAHSRRDRSVESEVMLGEELLTPPRRSSRAEASAKPPMNAILPTAVAVQVVGGGVAALDGLARRHSPTRRRATWRAISTSGVPRRSGRSAACGAVRRDQDDPVHSCARPATVTSRCWSSRSSLLTPSSGTVPDVGEDVLKPGRKLGEVRVGESE